MAIALTVGLTACSSKSGPHLSPEQRDDLAPGRAEWCVLQFVLDTGMVPPNEIPPNAVVDGLIVETLNARLFYQREVTLYLGPNHRGTVETEAVRATGFLQLVPELQSSKGRPKGKPALTPDQAAGTIIVQELSDAGYLDARDFGATQTGDPIQPGAAVDSWLAAHADGLLKPGVTTTVAVEKQRILGYISAPLPTPSGS